MGWAGWQGRCVWLLEAWVGAVGIRNTYTESAGFRRNPAQLSCSNGLHGHYWGMIVRPCLVASAWQRADGWTRVTPLVTLMIKAQAQRKCVLMLQYAGLVIAPVAVLFMAYALLMYKKRTAQVGTSLQTADGIEVERHLRSVHV